MNPLIRSVLSITTLGFVLWAVWVGYQLWQGNGEQSLTLTPVVIVFLVLSCVYMLAYAIQKGADQIAARAIIDHKVQLYERLLVGAVSNLSEAEVEQLKLLLGLHANIKVIQAYKQLVALRARPDEPQQFQKARLDLIIAMRSDLGKNNIQIRQELETLFNPVPAGEA